MPSTISRSFGSVTSVSTSLFFIASSAVRSISSSMMKWLSPPDAMIATRLPTSHASMASRSAPPN